MKNINYKDRNNMKEKLNNQMGVLSEQSSADPRDMG